MTRWQKFYLDDPEMASVPASNFSKKAAQVFSHYRKQKILDLACGAGRNTFQLAEQTLHVTGVDLARSGLEIARQTQAQSAWNLGSFIQVDACHLPFTKQAFDGVYCFGLLHEFSHPSGWQAILAVIQEINWVLAPGGILLLAVLAGDPQQGLRHVLLFSETMFDQATEMFSTLEKQEVDDIGCTGRKDYHTWQGVYIKTIPQYSDR